MKSSIFNLLTVVLLILSINQFSVAHDCISKSNTRTPWTNIPYFDGSNDYINVNEENATSTHNAKAWFEGSFSVDTWVKCTWPNDNTSDNVYFFFGAGAWDDDYNSFFLYFEKFSGNNWRIRIGDGDDSGSNTDILFNINYDNDFKSKWKHITVTYDDYTVRLYIDGVKQTEGAFDFDIMTHWHCVIGGHNDNHSDDFRGYISGFRIWTGIKLTDNEVSYIWDKTFNERKSFSTKSDHNKEYLYDHLKVNMFTSPNNIYSTIENRSMVEHNIERRTSQKHPARPPRIWDLEATSNCDDIYLDWESGSSYTTYYVYRKLKDASGEGKLICRTNSTYYRDDSPDLEPGVEYEYKVESVWYNISDPLGFKGGYYDSEDDLVVTASLKKYKKATNLMVTSDADSKSCDGFIKLKWSPFTPDPDSYRIEYKKEGGNWKTLAHTTNSIYTDTVSYANYGKKFYYRIDGDGDGCVNLSDEVSGRANEACTTAPTDIITDVADGNVLVSWDFSQLGAPATSLNIHRKVGGGAYEVIASNIDVDDNEYVDATASMCVEYFYKVEARNSCNGETGPLSEESTSITIPSKFDNVFTYDKNGHSQHTFEVSKGYYNQKVTLEWDINPNKVADVESFEIYRRKTGQSYTLLSTIDNANASYYEDVTTEANQIYEYMIRATGHCGVNQIMSDSLKDVGFRYSSGIVSGKITYNGGNAVEGVEVRVSSEEDISSNSLSFNGTNDVLYSNVFADDSLLYKPLSIESWIKPGNMKDKKTIFTIGEDVFNVSLIDMHPVVELKDDAGELIVNISLDTALQKDTWYHITTNFNPLLGVIELYINGERMDSVKYLNTNIQWVNKNTSSILIGANISSNTNYSGNIDEVRVWQKFRNANDIKRDYIRLLTGSEDSLIGYYRMDENFGDNIYDLSRNGNEFNKNDLKIDGAYKDKFPDWSTQTPSFEQLHPSGVTDKNGNYTIKGIRYSGSGNIFSLSPFLGVHEFNPTDINLFIGDGEPVHNNINFIDKSAFRFTGTVYYSGTNFPVEGADVYVDNKQQFNAGGTPVQTNDIGQIDISVPIGNHYISIKKDKHVFENNGQWPEPESDDKYPKFNFQDDVFNITFNDSTTVKVAGRFVGGDVEGDKVLGFNKSKANIGKGNIVFKNEQMYDIDINPDKETNTVTIVTDSITGEYEVYLLPEVYKIDSVWNEHYQMSGLDLGLLDLTNIPETTYLTDTTYTEFIEDNDTTIVADVLGYNYQFKHNFIYYEEPSIRLMGADEGELVGEPEYYVKNPNTDKTDTLDLINNSPFAYPIFVMGKSYDIDIRVEALYYNYDSGTPVEDIVPVKDAQVNVVNNIEISEPSYSFKTDENGKVSDYTLFRVGLPNMNKDESNGTSFTKTMTITAQAGDFNIAWNGGDVFRAYVLGGVDAQGSNYVTYGPEIPQFILRDPPGDRSYTSLLKGSSYTSGRDFSFNLGGSSVYDNVIMRGVKFEVGGGLAGPVFTSEIQTDLNIGISTTSYVDRRGEFTETYELTKTYSTSSDPNGVGSMADVYIGKSINLFFTETQNLRIYPKSYCSSSGLEYLSDSELDVDTIDYTIGKRPGFAVTDDPSETFFIYSQDHILNTLLPTYRKLIYTLLGTSKYTSKLPKTHLYYGMSNTSPIWQDTIAITGDSLPSYVFNGTANEVDSVAFLNQQIGIWLQTIAFNEASKVKADEHLTNISFDGNSGAYTNELSFSTQDVNEKEYFYRFELFGGAETGFSINKTGLMTYSQTYKNADQTITEIDKKKKTLKWKYVLDDSNQGDYFSVDIYRNNKGAVDAGVDEFLNSNNFDDAGNNMANLGWGTLGSAVGSFVASYALTKLVNPLAGQVMGMSNAIATTAAYMAVMGHYTKETSKETAYFGLKGASPIFKIMGGQSRCPYEGPEYTSFYLDTIKNTPYLINIGTQNHEEPKISIEPASIINVPDGSPAVFELKLMNNSPTGADLTYELLVDEKANPNGAVMRIDGLNPNRPFFIQAGQTLTKTLTVERGASGKMEYDSLRLILHSSCQFNPDDNYPDIADTVTFSAHFIPTCTEVNFGNVTDNWVVNSYSKNIMPINVTGYDINQPTFKKVYFQYQKQGTTPTTVMTLFNDTTGYVEFTGNKMLIDGASDVTFDFSTKALNDGEYTLFLTTKCSDGSIYESEHLKGIIDRITPRPFGTPEPSDGILSYGEDILVKFNEPINSGELYNFGQYGSKSYIYVRGMTNGTDLIDNPTLLHDASVHFDGIDDYMKINHINLNQSNFTIEFWAKRNSLGKQSVITIGTPSQGGLWAGFNADNNFIIKIDGQTMTSKEVYESLNQWAFYSIVYNRGNEDTEPQFTLFILNDGGGKPQTQEINIYSSLEGTAYIGYCPEDKSAFDGNIHEFRIWNYARKSTEISSQKGRILNGYERGLYGLYPMNEASGKEAKDIAFGRNAILNTTWQVSRNGKALLLDGTNTFTVPAGSMVFGSQSDFTMEFWYKIPDLTSDVTLFSNGYYEKDSNINAWNITATTSKQLIISNKGTEVKIDAINYIDNNWHHFAISLNRYGYMSIYIDGNLIKTNTVSEFAGFGASKIVFGARWYNKSMVDHYDNYTTGVIDEIRIWNSARTHSQIQRYMNYTLNGDELGLKAYFPFEDVTIEDPSKSNNNSTNFTQDTIGVAGDTALLQQYFTTESPNMKLQRPEILIPHTLVINNDKVVITPNIKASLIENQILDISIKRVKDLNNNEMPSTLTWTAFIDKNQVVWDMQELDISKSVEEEKTVIVNIQNKGGQKENYEITNIPVWMNVSQKSGSLSPLERKQIEITVNPELNIGTYQTDLNIVSSMEYNERLKLNIQVKGQVPNWSVDGKNYELTANVIGQLNIGDVISTDENDIVACFVGNECRGIANVQYFKDADIYLCFMNIYANRNGENIIFKVYDASTGDVYSNVNPKIIFTSNKLYGSITNPLQINATNYVEQIIDLSKGWNWISFNVYAPEFNDLNKAFANYNKNYYDFIKSHSKFAVVQKDRSWFGNIDKLSVKSTYKMKIATDRELTMSGYRVVSDTIQIPIKIGWNWIGYPLSTQKILKEALSSLNPNDDDIIKSQHQFAVYNSVLGWVGSLKYMQPGYGYVLNSSVNGTLIYSSGMQLKKLTVDTGNSSYNLPNTEDNMTMVVETDLANTSDYVVKAYDKNGLCGISESYVINDTTVRYFITINSENNNTIQFKAENSNGEVKKATEDISFNSNDNLGTLDNPFNLTFDKKAIFIDVYPNPFTDKLYMEIKSDEKQTADVNMFNSLGIKVLAVSLNIEKGYNRIDIIKYISTRKELMSGIYMLKVNINDKEQIVRVIKQ